jgi:UDP-N-acetylmuramoyl-tripeptide--D-alanyl-D-alanine ligase
MRSRLTLADVWNALSPVRYPAHWPNREIEATVIDSREAGRNSLFVALPGEHTDGHHYVAHAFSRGACAALVQQPVASNAPLLDAQQPNTAVALDPDSPFCILVDSTLLALQDVAAAWRRRFSPRIIAITGSVGKTSTKELTAQVLNQRYTTLKNTGNLNNELGLPLTLLQLDEDYQRVVLEMGMYDLGEIARLCEIARPQVGVITNVGPVHLERLGTIERIAAAKAELVTALPPDGVAVLNADDPLVAAMTTQTAARVFTYGLTAGANLWADDIVSEGMDGIRFRFHYGAEVVHVRVPLLGRHSVHTALRAAAVGILEDLSWEEIVSGLQETRAQLRLVVARGLRDATLLDDTYNASPSSSLAALNLLADLDVDDGRRVAVLGDMLELGSYEEQGHRLVGARAADVVSYLVTVGPRARWLADEAIAAGLPSDQVEALDSVEEAIARLRLLIGPGDIVLVKGSRSARLDQIVAALSLPVDAEEV